jgi:hypothetical protein
MIGTGIKASSLRFFLGISVGEHCGFKEIATKHELFLFDIRVLSKLSGDFRSFKGSFEMVEGAR